MLDEDSKKIFSVVVSQAKANVATEYLISGQHVKSYPALKTK